MLSKSQAKAFFLVGTAAFSAIFIGLTIDTFNRIPAQTNAGALSEAAIRGKHLFERNNCMGCHTILGEGAYYAPELTKVIERRGEAFVKAILEDPESMYPGQRKMTNYHFTDQQVEDLTAFLSWVGTMNLNGFPPKPDLKSSSGLVGSAGGIAGSATPKVFAQVCIACHSLNGNGGNVGPALDGVGTRLSQDQIHSWLKDPLAVKPNSKMPKLPLTDGEITELATFLASQTGGVQ